MKQKNSIQLAGCILLIFLALVMFAGQVSAEDCPCDPCPGGVECDNGCISICYLETNRCSAHCVDGKILKPTASAKFSKKDKLQKVYINHVASINIKSMLEQLFEIKLVEKGKAKKDFITIKSNNVDLDGILKAIAKEGLILQIK